MKGRSPCYSFCCPSQHLPLGPTRNRLALGHWWLMGPVFAKLSLKDSLPPQNYQSLNPCSVAALNTLQLFSGCPKARAINKRGKWHFPTFQGMCPVTDRWMASHMSDPPRHLLTSLAPTHPIQTAPIQPGELQGRFPGVCAFFCGSLGCCRYQSLSPEDTGSRARGLQKPAPALHSQPPSPLP